MILKVHLTQTKTIQRIVLLGFSCERLGVNDPQPLQRGHQSISEMRNTLVFIHVHKAMDSLKARIPDVLDQWLLTCPFGAGIKLNRGFRRFVIVI